MQTPGYGFEGAASHFNRTDGGVALCAAATQACVLFGIVGVLGEMDLVIVRLVQDAWFTGELHGGSVAPAAPASERRSLGIGNESLHSARLTLR